MPIAPNALRGNASQDAPRPGLMARKYISKYVSRFQILA